MKTRVISASVLLSITAACMFSSYTRILYLTAAAVLCCWEMQKALSRLDIRCAGWPLYLYIGGQAVLCFLNAPDMYMIALFILSIYLVLLVGIITHKVNAKGALSSIAVLSYPLLPLAVITKLITVDNWAVLFATACLATWVCDSFALFGGKRFGRHKLAPAVSPNKTVEGSICGAVSSAFAGVIIFFIFKSYYFAPIWLYILTAVISSTFGQVGDLAASLVKRMAGIKDFSNLIPGHGGMLDRADSLLFSIPTAYFCFYIFGAFPV